MSDTANQAYAGQRGFADGNGEYNKLEFVFRVLAGGMATATLVQVVAVHPGEGLLLGTVDAQLLVNQQDSLGATTPHSIVYGLPYCRVQAGTGALILDPVVGDIGVAVFASRDISSVQANVAKLSTGSVKTVNPGSFRRFDYSDGIYLFTALSAKQPTDYIHILENGGIGSLCNTWEHTGEFLVNGSVATSGNLSAGNGATGTFTSADGKTVQVVDGIVVSIA